MLYFKHSELAQEYHVSLKTVYNWIEAAKQGKIDLELFEQEGRTYIANRQSNVVVLRQLAQEGKKYRNVRFHKVVTPKPEFYKLYSREQILDIMTNLRAQGEIPRQYGYFDGGARDWDALMQRNIKAAEVSNTLKATLELIRTNLGAIDHLTENYSRINVVDIGPGNAYPVKDLLAHLVDRGVLHRYIAIDISQEMLRIAERNIKSWFGDKVPFEGYVRNIAYERFNDALVDDMLGSEADQTLNIMLLFGSTPVNFPSFSDPLRAAYGSMSAGDLLMYTTKPDTETSRRYFEFSLELGTNQLSGGHRLVLDLLNITEDLYSVEMDFDENRKMRYVRVRLNTALTIRFQFEASTHDVSLEKGSTILLLRVWHKSSLEIIDEFQTIGLTLLQSSVTKDRNYLLAIFGMKEAETSL